MEKKKWSLKEGSHYEEFALVDELSKIIKQVDTLRGKALLIVEQLLSLLIQLLVLSNRNCSSKYLFFKLIYDKEYSSKD